MTHCNGKLESILNTQKNTRLFQLLFEHQILPQHFAQAVLMEPQLNHYVTALRAAVSKKKRKRNASPATLARLTPRNTSIIYWSETRRRGKAESQIEVWRRIDGVTCSRYEPACSIFLIYFLPKSSEFVFSFTLYLSSTHTFSICWSVVVSREAISRPLAWITSEPAAVWHWT